MTKNRTFLTMVLYAATLAAILVSSWIVTRRPEAISWVLAGLIGFAALLILVALIGSRKTV
jgi:hypothetical protein